MQEKSCVTLVQFKMTRWDGQVTNALAHKVRKYFAGEAESARMMEDKVILWTLECASGNKYGYVQAHRQRLIDGGYEPKTLTDNDPVWEVQEEEQTLEEVLKDLVEEEEVLGADKERREKKQGTKNAK